MAVRKFSFFFIITILLFMVSACGGNDEENNNGTETNETNDVVGIEFPELDRSNLGDNVVAEYEGGEIIGEDFATFIAVQAFLNPETPINELEYRQEIIKEFIMEKVIGESAEEDEWANEQTDLLWEQIEMIYGEEEIQKAYDTLEITEEDVYQSVNALFKMESYFRDQVTDEEINEFYDEVKEELTTATFTHILIGTEEMNEEGQMEEVRTEEEALEKATELYEQLQDGADMNELATDNSDDPGSAQTGGRYEDSPINQLVPEFKTALLEQEVDEIGEPVKTDYGYHIIRVENLQVTPLEEVEEAIVSEVVYEKYIGYYSETLPDYIIEINLD